MRLRLSVPSVTIVAVGEIAGENVVVCGTRLSTDLLVAEHSAMRDLGFRRALTRGIDVAQQAAPWFKS